ncbi:sodium transport system permease protein [Solibacillus kalamii]|nr:ABC transporter permease [Solibacillus kalamii]MBM7666085.1 sodium transport system permease protein [Solibacillus kalamii]
MLNIFKKELKDTFRDQRTLILTVFLPLVLMSALVFFYEKMMAPEEDIQLHVVTEKEQLEFVKGLLDGKENLQLRAVDDVEATIKEGEAVAGLVLTGDFEKQIAAGNAATVQILGDEYSENSYIAMSAIEMALTQYSQAIVSERLGQQNVETSILTPFTVNKVQVIEGDQSVQMMSFLIPMMLVIAVGVGISSSAADFIAGEKERRTMEALLMTPVNRSSFLLGKWLTLVILATVTGILTLGIVFIEIYFFTEQLKSGLTMEGNVWLIGTVALLIIISFAALMASALLLTSIFGKTVKEAQSYGTPIIMVGILPALFITSVGLNELTTTHFLVPILNVFATFKELFVGIIDIEHVFLTLGVNIALALVILTVGRILFAKDKWVL